MVLTQELKKSKYSIHKAPRLSIMRMLHCKLKNMFIRPSYKDVRIRYMILLPIVMYLAQVIQVSVTLLWLLRKTPPLKKMSFMSIPIISQEYDSTIPETVLYLKKPMV